MIYQPLQQDRKQDFPFGPLSGNAGDEKNIIVTPQGNYRVEKVMAYDTGTPASNGTLVKQFVVGQKLQRPANSGASLAIFFGFDALGNGVCWDVCPGGMTIIIALKFVQACTVYGTFFGTFI